MYVSTIQRFHCMESYVCVHYSEVPLHGIICMCPLFRGSTAWNHMYVSTIQRFHCMESYVCVHYSEVPLHGIICMCPLFRGSTAWNMYVSTIQRFHCMDVSTIQRFHCMESYVCVHYSEVPLHGICMCPLFRGSTAWMCPLFRGSTAWMCPLFRGSTAWNHMYVSTIQRFHCMESSQVENEH